MKYLSGYSGRIIKTSYTVDAWTSGSLVSLVKTTLDHEAGSHVAYYSYFSFGGNPHAGYESINLIATISTATQKHLTDVPATGLHLISSKDGTTRNMAVIDDGFNPNDVQTVKIYEV